MRKLVRRLTVSGRFGSMVSSGAIAAEEEGLSAYACGASEIDCPYCDDERSAAWSQGFRRGDSLDASVW